MHSKRGKNLEIIKSEELPTKLWKIILPQKIVNSWTLYACALKSSLSGRLETESKEAKITVSISKGHLWLTVLIYISTFFLSWYVCSKEKQ